MPGVTSWRYAPIDATSRTRTAVIFPSEVAASSISCRTSRPWIVATYASVRSSIHFTGRAGVRASAMQSASSA